MTHSQLMKALITSVSASSFGMIWGVLATGMPLTMLLERLGASDFQIGIMVSVQQVMLLLQVPAAIFLERFQTRKIYWTILAALHRSVWIVPALAPFLFSQAQHSIAAVITAVAISSFFAQLAVPIWYAWMADLLPPGISARFWGIRSAIVTFTSVLVLFLAGFILDCFPESMNGFTIVFLLAALCGVLDVIIHTFVPEPHSPKRKRIFPIKKRFRLILKNQDFMWLTGGMTCWYVGITLTGVFGTVFMKQYLKLDYSGISLFIVLSSIGAFTLTPLAGKLADRFGARILCAVLMFLVPVCNLMWFFAEPGMKTISLPFWGIASIPAMTFLMAFPQFVAGGLNAGVAVYQMHLLGLLSRPRDRMLQMASHWFMIGFFSIFGSIIGGRLSDFLRVHPIPIQLEYMQITPYHILLLLQLLLAWTAAILLLRIRVSGADLKLSDVFRLVRVINPLRAVSIVPTPWSCKDRK